jgi:Small Multidrug Resistance protein
MTGTARLFERRAAVAWIMLIVAGLLEVVWAFSLKQSHGFTRLTPSVITIIAMAASFGLLSQGSRMKACDPMLGADFGEIAAPEPCLTEQRTKLQSRPKRIIGINRIDA